MKTTRIISIVLALLIISSFLISCGQYDENAMTNHHVETTMNEEKPTDNEATTMSEPVLESTPTHTDAGLVGEPTVGNIVTFGEYVQDYFAVNGKVAIEWIVLDVQEDKALLISRYCLDSASYHYTQDDVTWETCSLRTWLNETFFDDAFGPMEQQMIENTTLVNPNNQKKGTAGGNDTTDKVFLLSANEVKTYFTTDDARMCAPTKYAIAQHAQVSSKGSVTADGYAPCCWWVRTPGFSSMEAVYVYYDGQIDYDGVLVTNFGFSVRPAIWVNLP